MTCLKDGCRASAMKGFDFCYFHNPEIADKRKEASADGGRRGRGLYRSLGDPSMENLKTVLWETLTELRHSRADIVSRARAIAIIASVLIPVIAESSLEKRIEALEKVKTPVL
jgi:hypothetical protein